MECRRNSVIINVDERELPESAVKMIQYNTALLADLIQENDWDVALELYVEYLNAMLSRWKGSNNNKGWSTNSGWSTD